MKTILMQGDSITDAGRNRSNDADRGHGYALLTAAQIMYRHPGTYQVLNRGVSGDRIVDLYARMKKDILNLSPDYLTILIGVNDVWHEIAERNGVSDEKYYRLYSQMIDEVREELPAVKIYILEPFVLPGAATNGQWEVFRGEVRRRAASAKRIAAEKGLAFIPLQALFDRCCGQCPPEYWLSDGVHPTAAGHALICEALLRTLLPDLEA